MTPANIGAKTPTEGKIFHSLALCAAAVGMMAATGAGAGPSPYQNMTFSIDEQSATRARFDSFYGIPINGSDILTPEDSSKPSSGAPGPNTPNYPPVLTSPPGMFNANPPAGTPPLGLNLVPSNGFLELDALSYGRDPVDYPFPDSLPHRWYVFSVDEFAIGLPGTAVRSEGALGAQEASADTFISRRKPVLPVGPVFGTNLPFTDGDGISPNGMPGVGLIEPNPPTFGTGTGRDPGDNLDAVDFDTKPKDRLGPVYISLDSAFVDPLEAAAGAPPPNYGSAVANGYVGGDVIVGYPALAPGGPHMLYAPAAALGLDLNGDDTDDLDALKLWENGDAGYQKSVIPFDWLSGLTDMLLFSVRRNSDVIGSLDSIFGIPIEEGDVLTTPCPVGTVLPNGTVCVGGLTPGIFTAAEWLGLATVRSGTGMGWGIANPQWGGQDLWADDLDALDQKEVPIPATLALMGLGLAGLGVVRRRRQV